MADLTLIDSSYRALLIPDPRFTYDTLDLSASTITQAGALAGVPEPQRSTRAILEATGTQDTEVLTINTVRGGFVRDGGGAAYTWESTGVTGEIGWETPTALNDLAPVAYTVPLYARNVANEPAVCSLPDGRIVAAFLRQDSALLDKVSTRTRLPNGSWQSIVDLGKISDIAAINRDRLALVWDDVRQIVRLYVLWRDTTISGIERGRLSLYTSTDGGLSWALTQEDCLSTPLDWSGATTGYDVTGISVAFAGDNLGCLMISVTSKDPSPSVVSTVVQYASGDGGFTFDLVEAYECLTTNDPLGGTSYTVYADLGGTPGFRVVWSSATGTDTGTIYQADLGAPYTSWSTVVGTPIVDLGGAIGSISSGVITPTVISVAVDPVGSVWLYYSSGLASYQTVGVIQISAGGVGSLISDAAGLATPWVFGPQDTTEGLEDFAATFVLGGVCLLGIVSSGTAGPYVGAAIALTLGGYTGATRRPVSFGGALSAHSCPYEVDWYGVSRFGKFSPWTVASVGSPTLTETTSVGLLIDCSGGFTDSYQATYTPTVAGATQGQAQVIGQVTAGNADFTVKSADVINLRLRISATQIVVRDMEAAADLETITLPSSGPHIIRVSWHQGLGVPVYWRVEVTAWTSGESVRSWDSYDGTVSATVSANDRCRLLINNPSIGVFYHVGFGAGVNGAGLADDTLTPRPFSPTPSPVYHGVSVAMSSGPTMGGDSWVIAPRYNFGVRRIFQEIEPSPALKFKATASSTAASTVLVFDFTEGGAPCRLGSPVVGVGFFNANFRTATIATGATSSGPWTTVSTADLSCGLNGLAWERIGNTVTAPTTSPATGPHYIPENALAGCSFRYKSGEAARIIRNTGGVWAAGSEVKRPRLALDAPSADASGTSGTIVFKDGVALIYGLQDLSFLQITIPTQDTPSGVVELGNLVLGRVEILGRQYGRGRSIEVAPNIDVFTTSNGARRVRALGNSRQSVAISWQDQGIDTKQIWSDPLNANYVRAATGQPLAAYPAATADQLRGLLEQLQGDPLVYISKFDSDMPTMISPLSLLRGRILGSLTVDSVLGDEEESETVRVAAVIIEEEL